MHQQPWQFDPNCGDHERLELLRRLQAATRSSAMNAIPHRRLLRAASSINEVARELQDLAGGTEQLWQDVQRLFTSLISMHQSAIAAIVPVDDADMMKPSAQLDLVRQIRLLGGCRYVIPIVALRTVSSPGSSSARPARSFTGLGLKADFDLSINVKSLMSWLSGCARPSLNGLNFGCHSPVGGNGSRTARTIVNEPYPLCSVRQGRPTSHRWQRHRSCRICYWPQLVRLGR